MTPIMTVNVGDAIQGRWRYVVVTTFGLDLGFFERAILPSLGQARGRLVLADADEALTHQASAARGRFVRYLNRDYLLGRVSVGGAAHAKLILLLDDSRGRLLVGSGNLGLNGWGSGGELFTTYDYSPSDPSHDHAFYACREFLDGLAQRDLIDEFAKAYLEEIWAGTPWLAPTGQIRQSSIRHNLSTVLMDQLISEVARYGHADDLVLFAPFFDPHGKAAAALLRALAPTSATLLIQPKKTNVDPAVLEKLKHDFPQLSVRPFSRIGAPGTWIHAKYIGVKVGTKSLCLQGSANLSQAALMMPIPRGNVEVANLLVDDRDAFDGMFNGLTIGDPTDDFATLDVRYAPVQRKSLPSQRVVEAIWDGTSLTLEVIGWAGSDATRWLRLGTDLFAADVVTVDSVGGNVGHVIVQFRVHGLPPRVFGRAITVELYADEDQPPAAGSGAYCDPVFCVVKPALVERLRGNQAAYRLSGIGALSLDAEPDVAELVRALEGSLIFDRRSLIETRRPTSDTDESSKRDTEPLIRYSDVDYAALRADARFRQYETALHEGTRSRAGNIPTDLQLALRSIADAFADVVSTSDDSTGTAIGQGPAIGDDIDAAEADLPANRSDMDADEEESEETDAAQPERAWSDAARLRGTWRRFIDRFLAGLRSPQWQELAGTAVLSGNYEIFGHLLQRLHRGQWQDRAFAEYLVEAQTSVHAFVWGGGATDRVWLDLLPENEQKLVLQALAERHLAVRLFVDLAGAGALLVPGNPQEANRLVPHRVALRDLARAVCTHPAWDDLMRRESAFPIGATALATDLTIDADFGYWRNPPGYDDLVNQVEGVLEFKTWQEFEHSVADIVGTPSISLEIDEIRLGPTASRQPLTQDLAVRNIGESLDLPRALHLMREFVAYRDGERFRVHDGTARLFYDNDRGLTWAPRIGASEPVERWPASPAPWGAALQRLRELGAVRKEPAA